MTIPLDQNAAEAQLASAHPIGKIDYSVLTDREKRS
jgi:hypothetical protein